MNSQLPRSRGGQYRRFSPRAATLRAARMMIAGLAAAGLLAGCASGKNYVISVDGSIPAPLVAW